MDTKVAVPEAQETDILKAYLHDIGQHPLLTAAEETELAKTIEAGREAEIALDEANGKCSASQRQHLRSLAAAGEEAKQRFVNCNLRLVVSIAKQFRRSDSTDDFLDIIQSGTIGLHRAVEKFDHAKGFKFSTYAVWWIKQAMGRRAGSVAGAVELPSNVAMNMRKAISSGDYSFLPGKQRQAVKLLTASSLDSLVSASADNTFGDFYAVADGDTEEEALQSAFVAIVVDICEKNLSGLERDIAMLYLGLDRCGEQRTLQEVADILGYSRHRTTTVLKSAFAAIREALPPACEMASAI